MQNKKVGYSSGVNPLSNKAGTKGSQGKGNPDIRDNQTDRNLPPAGTYIPGQPLKTDKSKTIVIDEFTKETDLNRDSYDDLMTHGDASVVFTGDPNAERMQIDYSVGGQLQEIRERRTAGEDIGVVNISNGYPLGFSEMADVIGKPVNADNVRAMAPEYISALKGDSSTYDQQLQSL
ncbi:MAG: hypothetical protein AB7V50_02860, partial [Vampirovibrionia bacterium]